MQDRHRPSVHTRSCDGAGWQGCGVLNLVRMEDEGWRGGRAANRRSCDGQERPWRHGPLLRVEGGGVCTACQEWQLFAPSVLERVEHINLLHPMQLHLSATCQAAAARLGVLCASQHAGRACAAAVRSHGSVLGRPSRLVAHQSLRLLPLGCITSCAARAFSCVCRCVPALCVHLMG